MSSKFCLAPLVLFVIVFASGFQSAGAEDGRGRFCAGLNYPGVSVKYGITSRLAIEVRYQTESGVAVMGPRLYYIIKEMNKINLHAGIEADFITFTGEVSKGTGYAGEVFVGGEYFINRNLSFLIDIGPAFISMADTGTSESVSGIEIVLNLGINYYFGK